MIQRYFQKPTGVPAPHVCKDSRGFVSLSSVVGVARGLRTESVPLVNLSDTLNVVYEYRVLTS